jgi:hypothetical protein
MALTTRFAMPLAGFYPINDRSPALEAMHGFVRSCQTPILVLPDDVPGHPYAVAMESVRLAPKSEVSIYPWKDPKELIPQAVKHVREFLQKYRPVAAAR